MSAAGFLVAGLLLAGTPQEAPATEIASRLEARAADRAALDRVLERREFAELRRGPRTIDTDVDLTWLERFDAWLERLRRKLREREGSEAPAPLGLSSAPLATAVVLAIAFALGVLAVLAYRQRGAARRPPGSPGSAGDDPASQALLRAPEDWLGEADREMAANRPDRALRALYLALLSWLHRNGVLELRPARTSGEYRREVARRLPAAAGPFADLSGRFERAAYGGYPSSHADYQRARRLVEAVESSLPSTGAAS